MWCPLALFFYQDGKKFYSDFDDQKKPLSLTWELTQQSLGASGCCSGCARAHASLCMQVSKICLAIGYGSRSQPYSIFALVRCAMRLAGLSARLREPLRAQTAGRLTGTLWAW